MDITTSDFDVNERLLIWPIPVPEKVRALFTMVFIDVFALVHHVMEVLAKTDTFHFIIPLDCFEELIKDPVYKFRQVAHIDVICDSISHLKRAERRYVSGFEKVQFCTINDILKLLDERFISSGLTDGSIKDAVISIIEARVLAKQSDASIRRSEIQKESASGSLYGFPVRNTIDFAPSVVCPSCDLVNQRPCQLECKHQQCQVCVNIRTKCATCSKVISGNEVCLNQSSPSKIRDLMTHCSGCEWTQLFQDYEVHLTQNHYELITCFVHNQAVDESIFSHQHLTGTSQEMFLSNQTPLNSDKIVTSLNGTCIWEITNVNDIKYDARSGRPNSIYSAPFYLFPNGYKMRLRLFFNGVNNTRGTHLSLFLVIMRGDFDEILRWPFKFQVTFTLLNRLQPNDNPMKSFWSDRTSICFQRPIADMNNPYGFSKFLLLDELERKENDFIRNDTMFAKVQIDFSARRPEIPPNDDAHELMNDGAYEHANDDDISVMLCLSDNSTNAQQAN